MKGLIDIGANLAQEYFLEPNREQMNWLFFEPIPDTFDKMVALLPHTSNIVAYKMALGNITGDIQMFTETVNKGQSSSILPPKVHLTQYPHIKFEGKETVKIDKLDNIPYNRDLYDCMHLDTQGFELECLKGAVESLKWIDEITCEVNTEELYEGCPMMRDINAFLFDHGFALVSLDMMGGNWGDARYIRSPWK